MAYETIELDRLIVNPANDRHGELENETAAIAELFRVREQHMRNLASDIVDQHGIFDPPLVIPLDRDFVVYDGNRRVTCLKLIADPRRAPTQELQTFFAGLNDRWLGDFPTTVDCQVENDRDTVDSILFRRHTGSQGGVGQSDWDDRAKRNFVERTGRGGRVDVAVEIEALLEDADLLPERNIPRSTLNRLLSSEANRERVGVSVQGNSFRLTHQTDVVLPALARIAEDLSRREVVLGDLWNNERKRAYLNRLEAEGILPRENDILEDHVAVRRARPRRARQIGRPPARALAAAFIPADTPLVPWRGDQARTRMIW